MTYAEYEAQRAQIIAERNVSMRRYEEVSQDLFAKAESLLKQFNKSIRDHHINTSLWDQSGRWVGSSMIAMHVGDQEGGAS